MEKKDLEASKIVRYVPRTEEEVLGMDKQQLRERMAKAEVIHSFAVDPHVADASDVEINMEPKNLN
jgi:hypothetical protein